MEVRVEMPLTVAQVETKGLASVAVELVEDGVLGRAHLEEATVELVEQ